MTVKCSLFRSTGPYDESIKITKISIIFGPKSVGFSMTNKVQIHASVLTVAFHPKSQLKISTFVDSDTFIRYL